MGFLSPGKAPAAPPPPPIPPTLASQSAQGAGAATTAAAGAAAGAGFDNTLMTSPQGAPTPATTSKTLLGQ